MYDKKKSLLYIGCDFSDWYVFGEIVKIVASRRHILKLKCTKFDFRWGSPRHRWGSLQRSPDPQARERKGERERTESEERERKERGKERGSGGGVDIAWPGL